MSAHTRPCQAMVQAQTRSVSDMVMVCVLMLAVMHLRVHVYTGIATRELALREVKFAITYALVQDWEAAVQLRSRHSLLRGISEHGRVAAHEADACEAVRGGPRCPGSPGAPEIVLISNSLAWQPKILVRRPHRYLTLVRKKRPGRNPAH